MTVTPGGTLPSSAQRGGPVQNSGLPLLRRLADVDAVEDVPVVVDPLLDALPVTVLPECEEALGVLGASSANRR